MDAARCLSDPAWFEVSTLEGEVVTGALRHDADTSELAPGTWYGTFPGATVPCAGLTVSFEVAP